MCLTFWGIAMVFIRFIEPFTYNYNAHFPNIPIPRKYHFFILQNGGKWGICNGYPGIIWKRGTDLNEGTGRNLAFKVCDVWWKLGTSKWTFPVTIFSNSSDLCHGCKCWKDVEISDSRFSTRTHKATMNHICE